MSEPVSSFVVSYIGGFQPLFDEFYKKHGVF